MEKTVDADRLHERGAPRADDLTVVVVKRLPE
jgi:hypothetical protein